MHTVRNHVRKIRTVSDECLYKISEEVTEFSSKQLSKVVGDMILTQLFNKSIGLAAPQIGINKRIIITHIKSQMYIMINPYIVWGKKKRRVPEGCLSCPEEEINVPRYLECMVAYKDMNGKARTKIVSGLLAVIVQHEIDHLDGKLITFYKRRTLKELIKSGYHFLLQSFSRSGK